MPQLLLGLLLLVGLVMVLRWFATANTAALAGAVRRVAIGSAAIAGGGLLLAIVARNPLLLLQFAPFLLPFLYWWWRRRRAGQSLGAGWGSPGTRSSGGEGVSTVRTAWLEMTLEHASGAMDGRVLRGTQAGRSLGGLPEPTLIALLTECAVDSDSVRVLEAYLDRRFGPDWRQRAASSGPGSAQDGAQGEVPPRQERPTDMSVDEAYAVLGLKSGATADEIRAAYRKLMLLNHPDRGGSDWLAAKINRARQVLLGD
ncbi:molecular chaperone DnaJ [Vineibacter terrae]|uniref:Molecular chaperone DnaJ n=1 Tax=Vineibacter terrae TaxID=2586908 RepID=A0A5C8PLN7_9HYPH|nr:DnaJ domain-containing protein [Vineibacter terrae]TXL74338.1 molecular chaperone DnaJ [Vineibacter terrae]